MKRALVIAACLLAPLAAAAATWTVQPGASIQAAIDRAAPGDTVEIQRGRYVANLKINKPLTLRGIHRPTLSGALQGDTVRISARDVTIEGLIVRDSGSSLLEQNAGIYVTPGSHRATVRHCDLVYNLFGLWIQKANDVTVEHNLIVGKRDFASAQRGNGVQLYDTTGARIVGNHISFVRDALYVDVSHHAVFRGNRLHHSRYGTHYMNSYHNLWEDNDTYMNRGGLALMEVRDQVVRNNRAFDNTDHGIMLRTLQDSVIENNVVAGNARGFFIYDVEYAKLRGNVVIGNQVGVHLSAGSTRNEVEGNDFVGNREQVRYVGARDETWGAKHGNHWSNYVGWDRDGDGRGDLRYEANDAVDRLVWRYPSARLLLASPAVQALRLVAQQFPLLRVPSVVDPNPRLKPQQPSLWSTVHGQH
jgi:nitrous oxidase accessory protein